MWENQIHSKLKIGKDMLNHSSYHAATNVKGEKILCTKTGMWNLWLNEILVCSQWGDIQNNIPSINCAKLTYSNHSGGVICVTSCKEKMRTDFWNYQLEINQFTNQIQTKYKPNIHHYTKKKKQNTYWELKRRNSWA